MSNSVSFGNSKFGRNYLLQVSTIKSIPGTPINAPEETTDFGVGGSPDFIDIGLPLTISFDVKRNFQTSANDCSIRIYNLSAQNRNLIRKNGTDWDLSRSVKLYAGYQNNLSLIFSGQIFRCWSVREGVDFISEIECMDAGLCFQDAQLALAVQKDIPKSQVLSDMIGSLAGYGVSAGTVGDFSSLGSAARGNSFEGSTISRINDLASRCLFIDNGTAHCLNQNECLPGQLKVINSKNGLLATPVREQTLIHFDMIFEPRLIVGQYILLESDQDANFNGQYRVMNINHRGMISPSVCGEVITSVTLQAGINGEPLIVL